MDHPAFWNQLPASFRLPHPNQSNGVNITLIMSQQI